MSLLEAIIMSLLEAIINDNYEYLDNYISKLLFLTFMDLPEFKNNFIKNILNDKSIELEIFNKHYNNVKYKFFYHIYKIIQTGKSLDKKVIYDVLDIDHPFFQSYTYYFLAHIQKDRSEKIKYFKLAALYDYKIKYFAYWQLGKKTGNKYFFKKLINKKICMSALHLISIYRDESKYNKVRYYQRISKKTIILFKIADYIQNYSVCYYILKKDINMKIFIPKFLLYIILKK